MSSADNISLLSLAVVTKTSSGRIASSYKGTFCKVTPIPVWLTNLLKRTVTARRWYNTVLPLGPQRQQKLVEVRKKHGKSHTAPHSIRCISEYG